MKKIIVSVPYWKQYTPDDFVKCKRTKIFTEENTVKNILDFIQSFNSADLSSADLSEVIE